MTATPGIFNGFGHHAIRAIGGIAMQEVQTLGDRFLLHGAEDAGIPVSRFDQGKWVTRQLSKNDGSTGSEDTPRSSIWKDLHEPEDPEMDHDGASEEQAQPIEVDYNLQPCFSEADLGRALQSVVSVRDRNWQDKLDQTVQEIQNTIQRELAQSIKFLAIEHSEQRSSIREQVEALVSASIANISHLNRSELMKNALQDLIAQQLVKLDRSLTVKIEANSQDIPAIEDAFNQHNDRSEEAIDISLNIDPSLPQGEVRMTSGSSWFDISFDDMKTDKAVETEDEDTTLIPPTDGQ